MPTLLLIRGLRFFFYSNENNEPAHVHITKGNAYRKIWLEPLILVDYLNGFSNAEEKDIMNILDEHSVNFKQKWYEYFQK